VVDAVPAMRIFSAIDYKKLSVNDSGEYLMKRILLVVVLALSALPVNLLAAESGAGKESVATMEEVVVTATKIAEKRKDIANSVVILDALDIAESPAQSVGELLANEAGIDWRTRGNYGGASEEIHIRGMGADATQVVVDGVVINSPSLGSADFSQIPLNNIERVEVVKGPGSLLHGSGAMGGTVNIITKRPTRDKISAVVGVGFGSEATYEVSAEQGMFLSGDFGYYLTANHKESEGYRENGDLDHNDISLNLLLDKRDDLELSFNFGYVDREYGLPGPTPPAGTADYFINGFKFYDSESATLLDRGGDENWHGSLEAKGQATAWLNWRVKGDCLVMRGYNLSWGYNPATYSYDGSSTETTVTNTVRGVEGNLALQPFAKMGVLLGTEYRDFKYENETQLLDASGVPGTSEGIDEKVFSNGTFVEASFRPVEPVKLVAGYRYEENSMFGHENVSRYGMVVNPLANTVVKINHGKHFKAPTVNDLFWPDDGVFVRGNRDLQPETGWHSDLTVEQSLLDDNLFLSLSYFKWDIADKISWLYDFSTFYYSPFNLDSYQADGLEVSAGIGPYYSMRADLSLTLLDAEEQLFSGAVRAARYSPEKQFKCQLNHFADFGLTSAMTVRYVSDRPGYYQSVSDEAPLIVLDSYWTMDLKFEQELADHWRIAFRVNNLLAEEYDTYLASFDNKDTAAFDPTQQPYPGAGRSVFVSAAYSF
jgi:outer membrane cobalamin receptor